MVVKFIPFVQCELCYHPVFEEQVEEVHGELLHANQHVDDLLNEFHGECSHGAFVVDVGVDVSAHFEDDEIT